MKTKSLIAAAAVLSWLCTPVRSDAQSFHYVNSIGGSIHFAGNSTFTFLPALNNLKVGDGAAAGLVGEITGTYTIGTITTTGNPPFQSSSAPVTGTGQFVIHDGAFDLRATLVWVKISQSGTGNGLNNGATVNLSGITYGGTDPDLRALANAGSGRNVLSFQFVPAVTLAALKSGSGAHDTSFSGIISYVVGRIGDFVWKDLNGNGIQDASEPGIDGVNVTLTNSAGTTMLQTTTTATNGGMPGYYQFTGLGKGNYKVYVDTGSSALNGSILTLDDQGADPAKDSSPNPEDVTLPTDSSSDQTVDFGFRPTGSIGDFVWQDLNGDGIQDAGEPGINGVNVTLTNSAGTTVLQTTTTATNGGMPGYYQFTGLGAGNYKVYVDTSSSALNGSVPTLDDQGADPAKDSSPNPKDVTLPTDSSSEQTIDFGFRPKGSIGDFVWRDFNGDGIQDTNEPGIDGVVVQLKDNAGTTMLQTTTATNGGMMGYYQFTGLGAGTYTVMVDELSLPLEGLMPTQSNQGGNPQTDSNPNPATNIVLAANDSTDQSIDFGFVPTPAGLRLTKSADSKVIVVGDQVRYTYLVENTGKTTLKNVVVRDDNGTPNDTSDDFEVGTLAELAPGASQTFIVTKTISSQSQTLCTTINGQSVVVGTLTTTVLPNGNVQVTLVQSESFNDNRYGTGATAATGWPSGHKFGDLVGSDLAEFFFTNGNGTVVLDFKLDYISQAKSATFPSGTVQYPSGYGTLGVNGGDGKMVTGSAAHVLSATTSLSENLRQPQFKTGYLVNSPSETSPNSGVSTLAGWDYKDSYAVTVSHNAFGASGFGSVSILAIHDSPPKTGTSNLIAPTVCDSPCVVNVATATGTSNGATLTASATAMVCFDCGALDDCTPPYPYPSANPRTNIPFNESEVLRATALSVDANCVPTALQVFYNDEHALTLGVRQVKVKTATGTTTTNYVVSPMASNPGSAMPPLVGSTIPSGDQAGTDVSGRPMFPALFITDVTANPGNPYAGDWQSEGIAIQPKAVFGTWKAAVRTVDKTRNPNVVTVTPDADPARNNNNLGPGSDPVPAGLRNEGYGAEVRWDLSTLGLISGHQYRLYFMVHDGDQNKTGGNVGQACAEFTMP